MSVVTLGEAMLRLSTPRGSRLEAARSLDVHVGGSESNVAVALARLGVPALWLSRLPDNPLGRHVANEISAAGVDTSRVRWVSDGRVGLYFVEVGSAPRSTTVWYDRRDSAITGMKPEDLDLGALADAQYAVLSGISPALSENMREVSRCFVEEARLRRARVCFDVNYRARLWPVSTARAALAEFLGLADIVIASERDARLVFDLEGTDHDVIAQFQATWAPRAELIVITQSERGSIALGTGGVFRRHPAIQTEVVDRFGAGDAFVAGLLWGLSNGDAESALLKATAAAALKCTTIGDQAQFTQAEVAQVANTDFSEGVVR